jgi:hypothetical protein
MFDVVKEANRIRRTLAMLEWNYTGGGPYPFNPTMKFSRGSDVIEVTITQKEGSK